MPVNKDRALDVPLDDDTLKRAEEMCSGLSLSLSIEKRGQTRLYQGMLDDLNVIDRRPRQVTVAETPDHPHLTLICPEVLGESSHALLVFRSEDGRSRKLLGKHRSSRPGLRADDEPGTQVAEFAVDRSIEQ